MLFSTFPTIKALGVGSNLEKTSWADISAIAKSGEASKYFSIGDRKSITVGENTYCARIIGFNHDPLVSAKDYGTKTNGKAGITFEVKELYPEAVPYYADTLPTDTYLINWGGGGGGYASTIHSSVMRSIRASLPLDLRKAITWVQKDYYSFSKGSSSIYVTTLQTAWDDLFILSSWEMGISTKYGVGTVYTFYDLFGGKVSTYCRGLVNSTKYSAHLCKYWVRDGNPAYAGRPQYVSLSSDSAPVVSPTSFDASDVYTNFAFCV